ncbi:MAG: CPBP family intramembrane metalloprotease [Winogradskyella sp.]|uniref:CPBP family intramembrane glutamic endopeptidase n=1 Tax=Winogradskyella sp. TaxID=1883156 RepID=UPI000F3F22D2|nr:CPBP family intramembrane glutamic endopeptidase [Winogradskyella sp.]RNC87044.1 MAG: CPBP family intramembrane metalloprotease [Winogradskyella sp.]
MQTTQYKLVEFFLIFVITPVSFALSFPIWIKMAIGIIGFAYIVFVLLKIEGNKFKVNENLNWRAFWKRTLLQLAIIIVITSIYVQLFDAKNLFFMPLKKPNVWTVILFIYSFFSVYPQELIYRTFFFQRYEILFKSGTLFLIVNAALFSLAHIFFRNTLVMFLTFIGGILFALTFKRTKSTLLVSIEHAIYGCWLFTVGMGEMLGFPT